MKFIKPALAMILAALSLIACNAPTGEYRSAERQTGSGNKADDIQIYYFHNTRRCATCNAVENETRMALELFYPEQTGAGTIEFTSLNLEEEEGEKMAEALGVSGQTLLLVKGDKSVNLTGEGFLNARTNPSKFHEILRTQIDLLQ